MLGPRGARARGLRPAPRLVAQPGYDTGLAEQFAGPAAVWYMQMTGDAWDGAFGSGTNYERAFRQYMLTLSSTGQHRGPTASTDHEVAAIVAARGLSVIDVSTVFEYKPPPVDPSNPTFASPGSARSVWFFQMTSRAWDGQLGGDSAFHEQMKQWQHLGARAKRWYKNVMGQDWDRTPASWRVAVRHYESTLAASVDLRGDIPTPTADELATWARRADKPFITYDNFRHFPPPGHYGVPKATTRDAWVPQRKYKRRRFRWFWQMTRGRVWDGSRRSWKKYQERWDHLKKTEFAPLTLADLYDRHPSVSTRNTGRLATLEAALADNKVSGDDVATCVKHAEADITYFGMADAENVQKCITEFSEEKNRFFKACNQICGTCGVRDPSDPHYEPISLDTIALDVQEEGHPEKVAFGWILLTKEQRARYDARRGTTFQVMGYVAPMQVCGARRGTPRRWSMSAGRPPTSVSRPLTTSRCATGTTSTSIPTPCAPTAPFGFAHAAMAPSPGIKRPGKICPRIASRAATLAGCASRPTTGRSLTLATSPSTSGCCSRMRASTSASTGWPRRGWTTTNDDPGSRLVPSRSPKASPRPPRTIRALTCLTSGPSARLWSASIVSLRGRLNSLARWSG